MNVLIYDCEIINCVPDARKVNLAQYEYCEGWEDHNNMGISCIGAQCIAPTSDVSICHVDEKDLYMPNGGVIDDIKSFQEGLNIAHVLVGFNNQHFDDNLIKANGFTIPENVINYDILAEIWEGAGLPRTFEYPISCGFSLDAICKANGIGTKTGDGANAAMLWQDGKKQEVVNYCMNDIKLTRGLFDLIQEKGEIRDPRQYNKFFIKHNPDFEFKPIKVRKLEEMI